ncbi:MULTISPECIES: DUF1652 domain-containing protein [unclassified Pseudomonas]|uniref:DUF1652 domain-containing protein n=1 Tax=unclassified Pseudomonas TaxID=196821 RepID=UPI002AB57E35|nr:MULTISPECIES: DUF1652 domain-containing protein [unclassified Pseudomonas]MDY7558967.1 DUF1652 domain-containing protein [Pseudomonas sp. AB6]MEA9976283.1 DUF1652 domain-containing protein [Pseudomonas sp. RTS4]MEA9994323.1 DUF1652 domain-containing protein [Pseudomonas sp. AA4]MEB0041215.1 DUF1652 domain-containing protein [Pseudomonas sp. MH10]MEB0088803.1 DUF1652 domain-containing protein [Pseudomonas sp. RTI1]
MISTLELRHIVEQSFLPNRCECTLSADSSLTVRVFQEGGDRESLVVTGITTASLNTSRTISSFIAELQQDLENASSSHNHLEPIGTGYSVAAPYLVK